MRTEISTHDVVVGEHEVAANENARASLPLANLDPADRERALRRLHHLRDFQQLRLRREQPLKLKLVLSRLPAEAWAALPQWGADYLAGAERNLKLKLKPQTIELILRHQVVRDDDGGEPQLLIEAGELHHRHDE